jgi:hypothetical protein
MTTTEWLALWALIISGATLLTYLGQLAVLILVYRRVIKETDRNAEVRKQEIEKAGDMMRAQGKDVEWQLNGIAKRNTAGMAIIGVCLAGMLFANRAIVHKLERKSTEDR